MGRRVVGLMEKKSRLATQIEEDFKVYRHEDLSLGDILNKYFHVGQSDATIATELERMMKGRVKVPRSTLGNAIRLIIEQGGTQFKIEGKRKGNPYRKPGTGTVKTHHVRPISVRTKAKSTSLTVQVKLTCGSCRKVYREEMTLKGDLLNLMVQQCPKCGRVGKGHATYSIAGVDYYKTVVDTEFAGIQEEIFTGPDFKPVEKEALL